MGTMQFSQTRLSSFELVWKGSVYCVAEPGTSVALVLDMYTLSFNHNHNSEKMAQKQYAKGMTMLWLCPSECQHQLRRIVTPCGDWQRSESLSGELVLPPLVYLVSFSLNPTISQHRSHIFMLPRTIFSKTQRLSTLSGLLH